MSDIYKQHEAAFANVSAYVVVRDGMRIATIAFKFPQDGAGRLYVYVHWLGYPMVRAFANGYGYDKRSAACSAAGHKMRGQKSDDTHEGAMFAEPGSAADQFMAALGPDDGMGWDRRLREAGFEVWQAV